jgi:aminoglycoside 6'-N-acetyltransferase I
MEHTFKELTLQDLNTLIKKYIIHHNAEGGSWTYELAEKRLKQIISTTSFYGIGLYNESELMGFAIGWFKQFDDIVVFYLEEILVFKEYQNNGLGTKMLQFLENSVKKQGVKKISLSTTYEENHQNFYSRLGYKKSDFLVPMNKNI